MNIDYKSQNKQFWKKKLTEEEFNICRLKGTEGPGTGKYNKHYEKGIYYCKCCDGEQALFHSEAKYDSNSGWPSFYEVLPNAVIEQEDKEDKIFSFISTARTEVVCARCDAHLGHVFNDGPEPTGKRYCINSVALHFVLA